MMRNIWLIQVPRVGLWAFFVLNILAMLLYPGGTLHNPYIIGYSFLENFLSDLGRTVTYAENNNFLSSQLFNFSLIIAGIVYIMFYINTISIIKEKKYKLMAMIGSLFGGLGGISLIGVGFTPSNLYHDLHIDFAIWLFRFMLFASICYSIIIIKDPTIKSNYAAGYLLFTFSILIYIFIEELGPSPLDSELALFFQVVSQKIILLIFMITIYAQTIGIQKFYKHDIM